MRKKQIIEAAFKLFARHGYNSATMRQIGSAVGLDKSSLYVHFKNKNEIFQENLKSEIEQFQVNVLDRLSAGDIKTLARAFFIETVSYFANKDKLLFWKHILLLSASGSDPVVSRQASAALESLYKQIMVKLEAQGIRTGQESFSKMELYLYILTQGFLDWLLIQTVIDSHTMKKAGEVFDSMVENCRLFD